MRIVSQDKEFDLNYDTASLYVENSCEHLYAVCVNIGKVEEYELGCYDTKERALEVMGEIRKMKSNILTYGESNTHHYFYMPKE